MRQGPDLAGRSCPRNEEEGMKKTIFLTMVLICMLQFSARGQVVMGGRNVGLGLEFGDYPGVIAKIWTADNTAFSLGLGFGAFTRVHVDYLWHDFGAFKVNEGRLPLYYGVGGIINTGVNSNANLGVRGTCGAAYIFKDNNFDVFLELSPTFRFDPYNGLYLSGSLGVRYFFL